MAAIMSPYSSVGFYKTPVSKAFLGSMFIASCALNVPQLAPLKRHFLCNPSNIWDKKEIWKLLACRSTFLDIKDLICGCLLIYYFRVFERRYGSHKFASFLLATGTVALLLEVLTVNALQKLDIDVFAGMITYLSTGPFGLIFPLFVNYFFDIPRVAHTSVLGVPITGKTLTYLLGLQMTSSSTSSAISGICGLVAGIIWRYNVFQIQNWLYIPKILTQVFSATIGRVISSSPPQEGILPMGATLEIQRLQQMELLEQQILFNRARESRFYGQQDLYQVLQNSVNRNNYEMHGLGALHHRTTRNSSDDSGDSHNENESREVSEPGTSFKENQVQALVEMGFERQKVLDALRNSGNDVHMATTLLLQDS